MGYNSKGKFLSCFTYLLGPRLRGDDTEGEETFGLEPYDL